MLTSVGPSDENVGNCFARHADRDLSEEFGEQVMKYGKKFQEICIFGKRMIGEIGDMFKQGKKLWHE